ncbi:MAG TPA: hypothetical protein VJU79_07805 [Candidatus Dormibacteraeota bacterium]|nr:hypothetical protein [Candidatus Dormibacteraeota bacterium]
MERETPDGLSSNPAGRYLAMLKAARDFGLEPSDIQAIVKRFPMPKPSDALADALAEAILARGWTI